MAQSNDPQQPHRLDPELLRRYIQKRASPTEEERVELALLEDPTLLDDVIADDELTRGLREAVEAVPQLAPAARRPAAHGRNVNWAMAAAILMGVGAAVSTGGWIESSRALRELAAATEPVPLGNVPVVMLTPNRGEETTLRLPVSGRAPVLLEFPVAPPFAASYRLELLDAKGAQLHLAVDELRPQGDGLLAVLLPPGVLSKGPHVARVTDGRSEVGRIDVMVD